MVSEDYPTSRLRNHLVGCLVNALVSCDVSCLVSCLVELPEPWQLSSQEVAFESKLHAGSQGSGVAQVLSVDQERQPGLSRSNRIGHGTGSNSSVNANRHNNGSGNGRSGQGNNGGNPSKGVSLFGSYKAPIKQQ